jgi:fructokinase
MAPGSPTRGEDIPARSDLPPLAGGYLAAVATLCLGEAIVDLVCERPVDDLARAEGFRPHFGGAVANVAVAAAEHGAPVALAGATGDDPWGGWLRARLERAGVGLDCFETVSGCHTPVAFVTADTAGEPSYSLYASGSRATLEAVAERLPAAVHGADALFFSSNTLAHDAERELTMASREWALELGRPVLFDPNLRLHRWDRVDAAVERAKACVPGALLVRANRAEAESMTGESDPARAATALVDAGARLAIVTKGAEGAVLRGEVSAEVTGAAASHLVCTMGAGDVFTGVVLSRLAQTDFHPSAAAQALEEAASQAARATERWGAME